MSNWKQIRVNARISLDKMAARADVTATTARVFELDPDSVITPYKRDALIRVYRELAQLDTTETK